jgi:hypothetical protein
LHSPEGIAELLPFSTYWVNPLSNMSKVISNLWETSLQGYRELATHGQIPQRVSTTFANITYLSKASNTFSSFAKGCYLPSGEVDRGCCIAYKDI